MPDPFRFPVDYGVAPTALIMQKTLDGRVFFFRWLPNVRADEGRGAFYVDLFDSRAQAIVRGVKVVLTDDLWGEFRGVVDVPDGGVAVRRTDDGVDDPAIYDMRDPRNPVQLQSVGSTNVVIEYVSIRENA